jgi:hypothetical protein
MHNIHDWAKDMMNTSIQRGVWDEFPMLGLLTGDPEEPEAMLVAMSDGHPADYLEGMARAADSDLIAVVPATPLVGLMLFTEGWAVIAEPGEDLQKTLEYTAAGGRIENLPDRRVEIKSIDSWDGEKMQALSFKRGDDTFEEVTGTIAGRVPDAIKEAFRALNAAVERRNA